METFEKWYFRTYMHDPDMSSTFTKDFYMSDVWDYQQEKLEIALEALEFYSKKDINNHNYHSTMCSDLTLKAKEAVKRIKEYGR